MGKELCEHLKCFTFVYVNCLRNFIKLPNGHCNYHESIFTLTSFQGWPQSVVGRKKKISQIVQGIIFQNIFTTDIRYENLSTAVQTNEIPEVTHH